MEVEVEVGDRRKISADDESRRDYRVFGAKTGGNGSLFSGDKRAVIDSCLERIDNDSIVLSWSRTSVLVWSTGYGVRSTKYTENSVVV